MDLVAAIIVIIIVVCLLIYILAKDISSSLQEEEEKPERSFHGTVVMKEPVIAYKDPERLLNGTTYMPYQIYNENYPCILSVNTEDGMVFLEYYNFQYGVPGVGAKGTFVAKGNRFVAFEIDSDNK